MLTRKLQHIHVDAKEPMSTELHQLLVANEFYNTDFLQERPFGIGGNPPPIEHLTRKFTNPKSCEQAWGIVLQLAEQYGLIGYLEKEDVLDLELPTSTLGTELLPIPFALTKKKLSGNPGEEFRQDEVHLVMDWEHSNRQLVELFVNAGMGAALMEKPDHTAVVLTAQGFSRDIGPLYTCLSRYCSATSGIVRGSLKREVVKGYSLVGIRTDDLPAIVSEVHYIHHA